MTSISAYLIYRSTCCHNIFDDALYASSNSETIFDSINDGFICECGASYSLSELEYVGVKRETSANLELLGFSEIVIPAFLRKNKNL